MASMSGTSTLSVISRVSSRGDSREVSRAWATSPTRRCSSSWRPDRLTCIDRGGSSPLAGCSQRIRASTQVMRPETSSTIGW